MSWIRVIGGGALRVIAVALTVTTVLWALVEASPGTPAERAAKAANVLPSDDSAIPPAYRAQLMQKVAEELQLHGGLGARMARRLGGVAVLDFGRSWSTGGNVRARIAKATPATLVLVVLSLLLGCVIGLSVAIASVRREGGRLDAVMAAVSAVAVSLPPVWLAIVLARTFAAGHPWQWFPVDGFSAGGVVLPLLVMSLVPASVLARHARAELLSQTKQPWANATLARGVSRERMIAVHALRASATALLPLVVIFVAYLLGAAVVVERVFGIPGLGALLLDASSRGDAPTIVGVSVVSSMVIASTSLATDVAQRLLDPREAA